MIDELRLPDPAVILKVARLEQLIQARKFTEAYALSEELRGDVALVSSAIRRFTPPAGPGEAA